MKDWVVRFPQADDSDGSWLCMAPKRINFLISRRTELVAKS